MRIESSVTAVSWIPSEAVTGMVLEVPFEVGVAHYDDPPPEQLDDIAALIARDGCRFVNQLRAWIEVEDGTVVASGHEGRSYIGGTTLRLARRALTFAAVPLPDRQSVTAQGPSAVRFEQTGGGRTALPAPRRVSHPPYVQIGPPLAWSTLALTLHATREPHAELVGASPFPRHWVYDHAGSLHSKSATIDYHGWSTKAFGRHSPWGDVDSPAVTTAVETALERTLSHALMRGAARPVVRRFRAGEVVLQQGDVGSDVSLLLDGVLRVEVDGAPVADIGPGALLGERSGLEGGVRTATLRAVTPGATATVPASALDRSALAELAEGHRREES